MLKGGVTNISAPQKVQHILSLTFHFSARVRRFSSFSHCLLFYLNGQCPMFFSPSTLLGEHGPFSCGQPKRLSYQTQPSLHITQLTRQ